jgi:DNA-binding IclR family transcriptional regulator
MEKNSTRKSLIQSLERALNILEFVRDSKKSVRAIDIARAVDLSSAAANNIVRTLYIRGYLEQDENGRYLLGTQAYLLGVAADIWTNLRSSARNPMLSLSKKTNNLVFLGVEYHEQIIAVNMVQGAGPLIIPQNQDWTAQFHCTAAGKILLAAMDKEKISEFKTTYKLEKLTNKTIVDWHSLERELEEVRFRNYSVCHDESVFGITSIAVPVFSKKHKIIAALSVVFSSYYQNKEYQKEMLCQLQAAAASISANYES